MKKGLIIALSAGALYLLYTAYKKNKDNPKAVAPSDVVAEMPTEPPFACPEGEILCEKKEKTCFNPAAKYIVDPCL
jgi:hypothetical protein